jgi:inorganic pyrophosphatase
MPPHPPAEPLRVTVEVRAGSFIKRGHDGRLDFLSPVPCPFNYGSVEGSLAEDGDPQDAIVLGAPLGRQVRVDCRAIAVVRFVDKGVRDDKLVCRPLGQEGELSSAERALLVRFFRFYGATKRLRSRLGGERELTRFDGIELFESLRA